MNTGNIANWDGNMLDIGPIYPFVGWEVPMVIIAFIFWIGWHYLQIQMENRQLEAEAQKCESNVERSLAMVTALAPVIGYDKSAKIAKVAAETNRTVREVAIELSGLDRKRLEELLDPRSQV